MFRLFAYLMFFSVLVQLSLGNAGFYAPTPRQACSPASPKGCSNTEACVLSNAVESNRKDIDVTATNTFKIYQAKPYASKNDSNTFTIQLFVDGLSYTLKTVDQDSISREIGSVSIPVPALDKTIMDQIDFKKPVPAYYQMVFDSRNGGGDVYYSCADVFLVKGGVPSNNSATTAGDVPLPTPAPTASATSGSGSEGTAAATTSAATTSAATAAASTAATASATTTSVATGTTGAGASTTSSTEPSLTSTTADETTGLASSLSPFVGMVMCGVTAVVMFM
ncbi:hypothetical protein DFA_09133 [Cavenderia fasciculata]|uniref:Carbohydrate binding domain-containing protein n=1 Tax=Cavenderia fasciculata TaxID=261658 RepID=F4Q6S6_CACFS|nr:uncharacterized protein DFA_09133 [Cavenderia fasciculata]EGG16586.1 hypothetical protein DFA_09133 [Cavenderia fasciculata]|eukprot:XP_004354986.1 hypothetical protein DFA_09133 [Cavenderia fasciculata]